MTRHWQQDYETTDAANEVLAGDQAALRYAEREEEICNTKEEEARLAVILSKKDVRITCMALEMQARHDHIEYQRAVINWLRRLPEVDGLVTSLERGLAVKIRDKNKGEFPRKPNGASAYHQQCVEIIKEMRQNEDLVVERIEHGEGPSLNPQPTLADNLERLDRELSRRSLVSKSLQAKPKCEQCHDLGADPECTLCCRPSVDHSGDDRSDKDTSESSMLG